MLKKFRLNLRKKIMTEDMMQGFTSDYINSTHLALHVWKEPLNHSSYQSLYIRCMCYIQYMKVFWKEWWISSFRKLLLAGKSGSKVHPFMSASENHLKFTNSFLSWPDIFVAIQHREQDWTCCRGTYIITELFLI